MSKPTAAVHPNLLLLERLGNHFPHELDEVGDLISEDFVFHYFNSRVPELNGDYKGLPGLKNFFQKLGALTRGSFNNTDKQLIHCGDELVVTQAIHNMTVDGGSFETDAVVIWRVVDDRFVEAWDIPAVNTIRPTA